MIGIVDYGAGNIQSVMNALSFCGAKFCLARSPEELLSCDKALLPGVGAFGEAIDKLRANGMDDAIKEFVASGRYFLGICLGMQLLFEQSEEFVHSYHVLCAREITLASTFYGYEFASAIWRENVFAFQPHPEKSHDAGIKIIKNFTEL